MEYDRLDKLKVLLGYAMEELDELSTYSNRLNNLFIRLEQLYNDIEEY